MPVGLIPALIAGGASIAGAGIAAHAAGKAADTQAQSGQDALALQRQVYQTQQANALPYQQVGNRAAVALGQIAGQNPYTQQFRPGVPNNGYQASPTPQAPMNLQALAGVGMPQPAQPAPATGPAGRPPQMGERRRINGQMGQWDGHGWEAVPS